MAVDWSSLDSGTPRSTDGREYPRHLRAFERFDDIILPAAARLPSFTFDQLAAAITDHRARAWSPGWLTSAEWRGLVERCPDRDDSPYTWRVTPRGRGAVRTAA